VLCEEKYDFLTQFLQISVFKVVPLSRLLASCLASKRIVFDSGAVPCDLCGEKSGIGTDYSLNISVFLLQYYSTFFS
jgi:hypothetical protein